MRIGLRHFENKLPPRSTRPAVAASCRSGLTLIELLISISMMAVIAAAMGVLGRAVQMTSDYTGGHSTATQHARVNLERIARMVGEATANESFPGAVVFADTIGGWRYPDTLVVWHPSGAAANPTGLPLMRELIVYCPHPTIPNRLLQITSPADSRTAPQLSNGAAWTGELTALKTGGASTKTLLTDLVRTCSASAAASGQRGAVRFEVEMHPTASEWASYRAGTLAWDNIAWAQSIHGSETGLRQTSVRIELQLMPSSGVATTSSAEQTVTFLGASSLYYQLNR